MVQYHHPSCPTRTGKKGVCKCPPGKGKQLPNPLAPKDPNPNAPKRGFW